MEGRPGKGPPNPRTVLLRWNLSLKRQTRSLHVTAYRVRYVRNGGSLSVSTAVVRTHGIPRWSEAPRLGHRGRVVKTARVNSRDAHATKHRTRQNIGHSCKKRTSRGRSDCPRTCVSHCTLARYTAPHVSYVYPGQ
eukprot:4361495-Prymnesium_polylepis.1